MLGTLALLLRRHAFLPGHVLAYMQGVHWAAVRVARGLESDVRPRAVGATAGHHAVQVGMPDGRPEQQFGGQRPEWHDRTGRAGHLDVRTSPGRGTTIKARILVTPSRWSVVFPRFRDRNDGNIVPAMAGRSLHGDQGDR